MTTSPSKAIWRALILLLKLSAHMLSPTLGEPKVKTVTGEALRLSW